MYVGLLPTEWMPSFGCARVHAGFWVRMAQKCANCKDLPRRRTLQALSREGYGSADGVSPVPPSEGAPCLRRRPSPPNACRCTARTRRAACWPWFCLPCCSPLASPSARCTWRPQKALDQAAAASGTPVTSTDGRITLTKTASSTSLAAGGGNVTYTYTVKNNAGYAMYYGSVNDDKCGSAAIQSGYQTDYYGYYYIPSGGGRPPSRAPRRSPRPPPTPPPRSSPTTTTCTTARATAPRPR